MATHRRACAARRSLRWAAGLLLVPALAGSLAAATWPDDTAADRAALRADVAQAQAAYGSGDAGDALTERREELGFVVFGLPLILPGILALMLGGAAGVPLNVVFALAATADPRSPLADLLFLALWMLAPMPLAAAYLALVVLGVRHLRAFVPVGRLALTVYLTQSLVAAFVFTGYGLGLYGEIGALAGVGLSLAFFALQVVAARWWLARFAIGPAEWLVRSVTYGRRQELRSRQA